MSDGAPPGRSDSGSRGTSGGGGPHGTGEAADPLEELIGRLQGVAEQLRGQELSADAAATLVEECAALANRAGSELERRMRAAAPVPATGHQPL
jgi:hypothetical protein